MSRGIIQIVVAVVVAAGPLALAGCSGSAASKTNEQNAVVAAVSVSPVAASEQPIARYIRVAGSLTAEEQADVAAETAGRVVSTPVERGSRVTEGSELVRLSAVETEASLAEAQANAAQIEARLGMTSGTALDVNAVPEVQNAKASYDLAQSEFNRIKSLLDQRVVSQSEYDQRRISSDGRHQHSGAALFARQQPCQQP